MRSTKIKFGVACAIAASLLALMITAAGARAAAPVSSGKASATKSVCGMGSGKKATGKAIKIGGIDMLIPGVRLHDDRQVRQRVLQVRERQRRHQGPPDQVHPLQRAAQPDAAGVAGQARRGDKVHGIVGNTSFTECGTNWRYYKSKGFTVIGAGVQAECFGTPTFVESRTWATLQQHRCRAGARPPRRESLIVASPDTISAYADGGVLKVAKAAGIKGQAFPIKLRSRTPTRPSCSSCRRPATAVA
jgi:hypothetical protein